jgi:tetratricopeptide (TPR) repeat protein
MSDRESDGLTRFLAIAGIVLSLMGLFLNYQDRREKDRDRQLQLTNLLYGVRQLAVGAPGATWLDLEPFDLPREGEVSEELEKRTNMALLLAPDDLDAICYRGLYFLKVNRSEKALDFFRRALVVDPHSAQVHRYLSVAYQRRDMLKEAEEHAQRAISLDPDHPGAYLALGKVMSKRQDWDNALAQYRKVVEKDPTFYPAYNNIGFILLLQKDDPTGAIESFRRAVHFNSSSAISYTNWGLALEMQGKLDEAVEHYRRATEVNPGYANGYIALAEALHDQRKMKEALEQYRLAKQLSPESKSAKLEVLENATVSNALSPEAAPNSGSRADS